MKSDCTPPAERRAQMASREVGFASEFCSFVQSRLALVTAFLGLSGGLFLVVSRVADVTNHGWVPGNWLHPSVVTHALGSLLALPIYVVLRGRTLSATALKWTDVAIAEATIAVMPDHVCVLLRDRNPADRADSRAAPDRAGGRDSIAGSANLPPLAPRTGRRARDPTLAWEGLHARRERLAAAGVRRLRAVGSGGAPDRHRPGHGGVLRPLRASRASLRGGAGREDTR